MINHVPARAAAALLAASLATFTNAASATPLSVALTIQNAASSNVEAVRWGWRGGGWGRGLGAGLVGGAIIGGALAAPYNYGYRPYYPGPYYAPVYGPPPAAYGPPPGAYGPGRYRRCFQDCPGRQG
jgi:hypothetical protein